MTVASQPVGRRERNKQAKLERIMTAASELFAEHGVDEVTTQPPAPGNADRARFGVRDGDARTVDVWRGRRGSSAMHLGARAAARTWFRLSELVSPAGDTRRAGVAW